ncbi:MAG: stage III sporulation protein AB, partial [Clostridia bacterium]|nr:stage III sporulation protein AB [Clostridia bacterium]
MVVWLGAAAVVAGTATLGFLVAENLARRPQHLHQLRTALQVLQTEIDYAATPLPEALERAGRHLRPPVHDLLAAAAERLRQAGEEGAAAAWAAAVAAVDGAMAWTARDREAVLALGPSLGTSHREDQLRHLQ